MIIPVQPVPVRISIQVQSITDGYYFTTDLDIDSIVKNAESCCYELDMIVGETRTLNSKIYNLSKDYGTITFLITYATDIYTVRLRASDKQCLISKLSLGLTEYQVNGLIANATNVLLSSGLSENITNIDGDDGVTLTVPSTSVISGLFVQGRLILADEVGNSYVSDFAYNIMSGFTLMQPGQGSVFSFTSKTKSGYNTGTFITCSTGTFSAYVLWYYNPDSCYLTEGEFTPEG